MDLFEEFSFARSLRVTDSRSVGRLRQHYVWSQLIDPCSSEMAISTHVIVTGIYETFTVAFDIEHGGTEDMTSIVSCHLDLSIAKFNCLVQLDRPNLVNAVFDHLTIEAVDFALLGD